MNVTNFRIDDRLIHGQIVTQWIADSAAKRIVVADDRAAADPTQQMLLKLTVPGGISLDILTIADAAELLARDESEQNVLLIVRNPKAAYELVEAGFSPKSVNVGNISNSRSEVGRKRLLAFIYVEPDDVAYLRKLMERGIELEIRAVPADRPIDVDELLRKNSL
ncbi:PTS system mannose/fructose/N-acetylgalactosamine-transporter subunit IIB [Olsenella sp. An188]|uniref:PTS system mannose/fructose/N-acetylgalactosamine-transporter subunit IIB n=1 Tax=Olsenella sp. An188 TaxID=1965579 RepID=UPI000B371106|nr:PTS sugar transporter subunit IIB [Olsenella sp. An188]OUP38769.1 PTS mannose/fructose/sorbose transporter subunit IIB [Olsenella sp. An188]HJB54419.1 PTS sugar transporter subunit IIB [Candidatus Olsenella avistercoris]